MISIDISYSRQLQNLSWKMINIWILLFFCWKQKDNHTFNIYFRIHKYVFLDELLLNLKFKNQKVHRTQYLLIYEKCNYRFWSKLHKLSALVWRFCILTYCVLHKLNKMAPIWLWYKVHQTGGTSWRVSFGCTF